MKRRAIYAIQFTGSNTVPAKLVSGSDCQVSAYTDRHRADEICNDLIKHRGPRFRVVPYASAGDRLPEGDLLLMAENMATVLHENDWGRRAMVDFLLSKLRGVAESAAAIGAASERSAVRAEFTRLRTYVEQLESQCCDMISDLPVLPPTPTAGKGE